MTCVDWTRRRPAKALRWHRVGLLHPYPPPVWVPYGPPGGVRATRCPGMSLAQHFEIVGKITITLPRYVASEFDETTPGNTDYEHEQRDGAQGH